MSKIPKRAKRDVSEKPIVEALRQVGCTVQKLSMKGVPDLLVGWIDERGCKNTTLLEIKSKKGKRTPDQIEWALWWTGTEPIIVRSVEDALRAIKRI